MWSTFIAASSVTIAMLYLPGFVFWRSFRFEPMLALCAAPVASTAIFEAIVIGLEKAGATASAPLVGLALLSCCIVVACAAHLVEKARGKPAAPLAFPLSRRLPEGGKPAADGRAGWRDWAPLAACVACGTVVTCSVFLSSVGSPETFLCRYDNQVHISYTRAFLDSGTWSPLSTGEYLAAAPQAQAYEFEPAFYPACLHGIAAFASSATGASVACGLNASCAVFAAVVAPMSLFAFVKAAFPNDAAACAAGAVTASACLTFPWWFFISGPLYPNFAGFALVPASAACAIALLESGGIRRKAASALALAVCSVIGIGFLHPNALFSLLVVLASYGASHVYRSALAATGRKRDARRLRAVAAAALFLTAIIVFWIACLHAPMLESVVNYGVGAEGNVLKVLFVIIWEVASEPLFAIAVIAGIVVCCKKRCYWILAPAAFMAVASVASRVDPDGIGHVLGGFWYTDYRRLQTCLGLNLIPLAACGLGALVAKVAGAATARASTRNRERAGAAAAGALMLAFLALNLGPSFSIEFAGKTLDVGFGSYAAAIHDGHDPSADRMYSGDEIEFVNKAAGVVGEGELVLNQPNDGSTFAYGINGLDTYFRRCGTSDQTEAARLIRTKLREYGSNPDVKEAVRSTGARYVLLLDYQVPYEAGTWLPHYKKPEAWEGLNGLIDGTPGFETVLAEDGMRLYRLTDLDDKG